MKKIALAVAMASIFSSSVVLAADPKTEEEGLVKTVAVCPSSIIYAGGFTIPALVDGTPLGTFNAEALPLLQAAVDHRLQLQLTVSYVPEYTQTVSCSAQGCSSRLVPAVQRVDKVVYTQKKCKTAL